ncbi:MAG TPA: S24 family peptidase [Xanthobacteraceae bacterium]|nr:S24 family peptidase [Xanthobacteraceae bacterium]
MRKRRKAVRPPLPSALAAAMKESGITMAELARQSKTSRQQVQRLVKGGRKLSKEWAERFAPHLGTTAAQLMFGPRTGFAVGYVGAGEFIPIDDHAIGAGLEEVEIPAGVPDDAVLLIVRGDSMAPRYFDNEYLFYRRDNRPPAELIGRECVIKLTDGRMYVKELRRGEAGLFTLFGWNSPLIENVTVEWAAPVLARLNRNAR